MPEQANLPFFDGNTCEGFFEGATCAHITCLNPARVLRGIPLCDTHWAEAEQQAIMTHRDALQLQANQASERATCPVCDRVYRQYARPLYERQILALAQAVYEHRRTRQAIANPDPGLGGDWSKLRHWGFLEELPNTDPRRTHSGHWIPTDRAVDFLCGRIRVRERAMLDRNKLQGYAGHLIDVTAVMGEHFNVQNIWRERAQREKGS